MDFGRTGHGEGERFLPLDGRNLSCCLRPPVIDRWLSSGQKKDGAVGSSRQQSIARAVFSYLFADKKVREVFLSEQKITPIRCRSDFILEIYNCVGGVETGCPTGFCLAL